MARTTLASLLMGIAAAVALILGVVGLYAVVSYTVARRTSEIGVRMALGAEPARVKGLIVREAMTTVVLGVILGLGIATGVSRLMESMLYGVEALDPLTFGLAAAALGIAAALAAYLPASRASRVDPVSALRAD